MVFPLALLPGCLTADLWRGYAWPEPVVEERLVARESKREVGTLVASQPVLENGLWWFDGEDRTPSRWWLGPEVGAGAEFVAALLADPGFCTIDAAAIDAVRSNVGEEVIADRARLELEVRVRSEAIGAVVPTADISPAAVRALAAERRNAYLVAADPAASLPVVCSQCAERLPAVDLRSLVGAKSAVHADAWVFVDRGGRPAFQVGRAAPPLPLAAWDEDAPLADRLEALRALSLLVRVCHGSDSTILRLRPDRLWLLSGLEAHGERFVHRSGWHLQTMPMPLAVEPAVDAERFATALQLQQERYERSSHPVLIDGGLVAKVALTPVTLALDLALGPGVGDFLRWITGTGPAGGPQQPRDR
ncbi:MAG TPA: hypothetical protein VF384_15265 [Planctomycetota bacterium]